MRSLKLDERLHQIFPFPPEVIQPKYFRLRSRVSVNKNVAGATTPHIETGAKLRLISENLDLDYSRSLYDDADQSLDLTYKLTEGVFTRLRWENSNTSPVGDTGLDLKLHWEW